MPSTSPSRIYPENPKLKRMETGSKVAALLQEEEAVASLEAQEQKQTGTVLHGLCFVGPTHSAVWQTQSAKRGSEQTLFATGSGLSSSDLSQPGSVRHLTSQSLADHELTNEECRDMLAMFFSDIYPSRERFLFVCARACM